MIMSTATFHFDPSTFCVRSEYECMLAFRPACTRRLAQNVEMAPEAATRAAVHTNPPVAKDLGRMRTRMTQ